MDKHEFDALVRFTIDQYYAFDAAAWVEKIRQNHAAVTVAALYLSMTSWYGHEDDLQRVGAVARAAKASGSVFRDEAQAQAHGFDLTRFSSMVRCEIMARRLGSPDKPAAARQAAPRA